MTLTITALTAAICAIMLLITAIDTVRHRQGAKVAFGDGGGKSGKLVSASRSHGNLAEHAPIVIIMIGLLEMAHAQNDLLKVVAGLFLAFRAAHIVGIYAPIAPGKIPLGRSVGVLGTWVVMAVLILWILYLLVSAKL